ncbi:MAG: hypothetical protein JHC26_00810 [Thermofilum sp.]|jgi:hypothetical protein|uniref:hypothetical protein n=1 Tax=Thermofilum sp. TaxID=1961369 RepID=UPI0025885EF4|nr:hypothetical protein [Thermofilum sp.]MCI4407605.1 hypothetical protein [Thermofilum sp.]
MKRIFLLLLAFFLIATVSVFANPQSVVLTPSNWQDVNNKIQASYIGAFGTSFSLSKNIAQVYVGSGGSSSSAYIYIVFVNGTVSSTNALDPVTLNRGIYVTISIYDSSNMIYYYIYNVSGLVASGRVMTFSSGGTSYSLTVNKNVYVATYGSITYDYSGTGWNNAINTLSAILRDWQGQSGGKTAWLLFNVTGNMPVSYVMREGSSTYTLTYGGGSPIYMLYVAKSLPVNVTGSGLNQLFSAGAYLIQGSNWYKANYTTTSLTTNKNTNNSTSNNTSSSNMATLTVTVKPSTYTIQYLLQGALVKQANGTLSYQFPKNTTVTIRILNGNTEVYKIDYKIVQDMSLFFNFGNDNSLWNPSQTGSLTLQFYEADPQSGYLRGQIIVDSVQLIGLNNSVTRTASGVSQITFTNLPFGHYEIIVQKSGYFESRVWIFFNQSQRTIRIGMLRQVNGENMGTDKPLQPSDFIGDGNYNGTNIKALTQARNQTPPSPSVSGNFYGFHIIVTDSSGNLVSNAQVQILAVKSINKVLWQDTATYPLAIVNVVNGSAYWYITEEDLNKALQYAGFWESFAGFKVVVGTNSMFVPSQFAYNRFYELRIVQNQNIFGNGDIQYQGNLFGSAQSAQLIGLLFPIMILGLIGGILKEALKSKK